MHIMLLRGAIQGSRSVLTECAAWCELRENALIIRQRERQKFSQFSAIIWCLSSASCWLRSQQPVVLLV